MLPSPPSKRFQYGSSGGHVRLPEPSSPEHDIPVLFPSGRFPAAQEGTAAAGMIKPQGARLPLDKPTHAGIWCGACLCIAFSLLLIAAGVVTLVVFLVIKPRHPHFDASGATLNSIYIDSPGYVNGDLSLLANFSNPNRKMEVHLEHVSVELYFRETLIAAQALQPFSQRRGEVRLESVHMVTSEVYLPPELVGEMRQEMGSNRVVLSIRGTFKVKGSLSLIRFSYWLYARCSMVLTSPPSGVLVSKTCRTGR